MSLQTPPTALAVAPAVDATTLPALAPAGRIARRRAQRPGVAPDTPVPDLRHKPERVVQVLAFGQLIDLYYVAHPSARSSGAFNKWRTLFQLEHVDAWTISPEQLGAGAEYLRTAEGYEISTVNRELSQLGTIYKWAIATKICPEKFISPTRSEEAGRKKETMRYVEPPKPGEWQKIRLAARGFKDPLFTLFVWLIMDTGARRGEISDRHWTAFDLDAPEGPSVTLRPRTTRRKGETKTGKPRRLYFSQETAALLRRLRPGAGKYRDQLVFKSPRGVAPNKYRKSWARLCKMLGRDELHLHDMRHLLAADLLKAGKGVSQVSSLLGNSSLVLHQRYGHLDDKAIRDIQSERLGLDAGPPVEYEAVRSARERHATAQATAASPMAEAQRLALLAQDAADAAAAASVALAAAQEAMRVAMAAPALPFVERVR